MVCILFFGCKQDSLLEVDDKTTLEVDKAMFSEREKAIMPEAIEGILKFENKQHLFDYQDYLQEIQENFDFDSADKDVLSPALDEIDAKLNFNSLRKKYENLNNLDENFKDHLEIVQLPPSQQCVFNEYNEIWIENKIYKKVANGLFAVVLNGDISKILALRSEGSWIKPGIRLYNTVVDEFLPLAPPAPPTTESCNLVLNVHELSSYAAGNGNLYLKFSMLNSSGIPQSTCGGTLTFKIDGASQTITNLNSTSQFNINVAEGGCHTFKISDIFFEPSICGSCALQTTYSMNDYNFTLCDQAGCITGEDERPVWSDSFTSNGDLWRASAFVGHHADDDFWGRPEIWGRLELRRNNKLKRPKNALYVRVHGNVRANTCNGTAIYKDEFVLKKKRKLSYIRWYSGLDRLVGRKDDNAFADFKVFHDSNNFSSPDIYVDNVPIFTMN